MIKRTHAFFVSKRTLFFLILISMTTLSHALPVTGMVQGYKFHDLNGNGIDDNEPRLSGVTILLQSEFSPPVKMEDLTDSSGSFSFINLPLGKYQVCELVPEVTPPWIPTTPECFNINLKGKTPYAYVRFGNERDEDGGGCTRTQGYWGSSPAGQAKLILLVGTGLTLGNRVYTAGELDSILDVPTQGNALLILAHQLIAAKLNVLAGASSSQVSDDILDGENLIGALVIPPVGGDIVNTSSVLGQQMTSVATNLDLYNNGELNVPHCNK